MILAFGFLWFGTAEAVRLGKFGPVTPYQTTDRYLDALTHYRSGSERLSKVFAALPEKDPIAFIFREDNDLDTLVTDVASYLAWPKKVRFVPVRADNAASQLVALRQSPLGAIVFCGIRPPPALGPMVRVGDGLVVVLTADETAERHP